MQANNHTTEPLTKIGEAVLSTDSIELLGDLQREDNYILKELVLKLLKAAAFISVNLSEYEGSKNKKAQDAIEYISCTAEYLERLEKP